MKNPNDLNISLTLISKDVSPEYIPPVSTRAYKLLSVLADGKTHKRSDLAIKHGFGETLRSPLELLKADKYGNWKIDSIDAYTEDSALQLDHRHLSGDPAQDREARRERKKVYKERSAKDAVQGKARLQIAISEMNEAQIAYLMSLGDAANDEQ
ncbi:hypothetical protein RS130_11590 [Paraglaciecola aquimarina]|uniref:Uncharacterized protein n=1 Tax=Paraglaciecola aquimarina TaxID=1235557 RepID=A0ABU3SX45_9ALTE|nr:hypothetical protein [Paraglaciecola aquimarina]MDU0354492.1 hypothetical protein [Paraglaciecola aquimarina]